MIGTQVASALGNLLGPVFAAIIGILSMMAVFSPFVWLLKRQKDQSKKKTMRARNEILAYHRKESKVDEQPLTYSEYLEQDKFIVEPYEHQVRFYNFIR